MTEQTATQRLLYVILLLGGALGAGLIGVKVFSIVGVGIGVFVARIYAFRRPGPPEVFRKVTAITLGGLLACGGVLLFLLGQFMTATVLLTAATIVGLACLHLYGVIPERFSKSNG